MRTLIIAWALALAMPTVAFAAAPASGEYENGLILAFDPATGSVTGDFSMQGGEPQMFSCDFYIRGKLTGAQAAVDTFYPPAGPDDLIKGRLTVKGPRSVEIVLPTEHGGCGNVWQFADPSSPADFDLQTAHAWTSIRVAKAAKTYFYATAGAAAHGRAYIVAGDAVGVRGGQVGWVQADYVGGAHLVTGWLREADLFPAS